MKEYVSLYEPLQVEIGGKKYQVRKQNREFWREQEKLQKALADAQTDNEKIDLSFQMAGLFIDAPQDEIDALDINEIHQIQAFIFGQRGVGDDNAGDKDPGKNGLKPGDEAPAA